MQTFRNTKFTKRDYETTNIVACVADAAPGDNWELAEVPLGESSERYDVTIHGGGVPLRRLTCSAPQALYEAGWETADFGAPQATLDIAVAQLSEAVGLGHVRRSLVVVA
jgi:hypothetical protein